MPCSRDRDFTIQSYSQTETRQNLHMEEGQTGVAALAGCCSLLLLQQLFSQNKPNRTTITHSSPLPPPPPTSRGSNRPLIRYEERCVVWHLPQIPLINNSLPPTHFSKQTHNQDSFSLSLQKQRKETQSSDAASCCFSPSFSYLGLSLKILTHPATMKEAFGFRGQTIYLLRAQGFKNRQTA
jgi:hypothetical protein